MSMYIVTKEKLDRLHQISNLRRHYCDQLEGMSQECVDLLCEQNDSQFVTELASSIVDHGADVSMVVAKMTLFRANQHFSEAAETNND